MMFFVDREKIETTLVFLEGRIGLFSSQSSWESLVEKAALERITQTMIESVIDVGNAIIDGFIMRDPGSYEDIIDILTDEKVISSDMSLSLKTLISYRKMLVQSYTEINYGELQEQFMAHLHALKAFIPGVREYIKNELGPVSAFRN